MCDSTTISSGSRLATRSPTTCWRTPTTWSPIRRRGETHSGCRPREGGDPYAVSPRCGMACNKSIGRWLWVPAFAGTTGERHCPCPLRFSLELLLRADGFLQHLLDHRTDVADAHEDPLDLLGRDQLRVIAGDLLEILDKVLVLLDRVERPPQLTRRVHRRALREEDSALHLGRDIVHEKQRFVLGA